MRRPNPWIAVPALVAGLIGGWLGYVVTDVSCRAQIPVGEACPAWAISISIVSFIVTTVGIAIVIVLVYRSLAEANERSA